MYAERLEPSFVHKCAAGLLVLTLCALELRAIVGPHEDWPFTSAPMFARYVAAGDPLYELHLVVELPSGSETELDPKRDLGMGELGFRRQFFTQVYGSTDPRHPSQHRLDDSRERFRARLLDSMKKLSGVYTRRSGRALAGLRLEVWRLEGPRLERRPVARYGVANQQLTLLWPERR